MRKFLTLLTATLACLALASGAAYAAGGKTEKLDKQPWSFKGMFGSYDKEAVQRGLQVYREACATCHSMDFVAFRHLGDKGGPFHMEKCPKELLDLGLPDTTDCSNPNSNPVVRAIAAEYTFEEISSEDGLPVERTGLPSDYFPAPYPNKEAAAAANGGAVPPDLSLIAKARKYGPDYVYNLLTGYPADGELPKEIEVQPGQYYNPFYKGDTLSLMKPEFLDEEGHPLDGVKVPYGGVFKMAPPLREGAIDYAQDGVPETVEQYAKDVVYYLMWAAEPKLEARKKMGMITLIYLFIFAGILYASYKQVWRDVDH